MANSHRFEIENAHHILCLPLSEKGRHLLQRRDGARVELGVHLHALLHELLHGAGPAKYGGSGRGNCYTYVTV